MRSFALARLRLPQSSLHCTRRQPRSRSDTEQQHEGEQGRVRHHHGRDRVHDFTLLLHRAQEGAVVWLSWETSLVVTAMSLWASRNENKHVVMMTGHMAGKIASRKALTRVQLSSIALLLSLVGIDRKKKGSIHSLKG